MVNAADAVAAVFAHHGEMPFLDEGLDGMADVPQVHARLYHLDAAPHRFVAGLA